MLIALASTLHFHNQIYFMKIRLSRFSALPSLPWGRGKREEKFISLACSTGPVTQIRTATEVMRLPPPVNWAPSEETWKCCLAETSGGFQLSVPPDLRALPSLLDLTSPTWGLTPPCPWLWNPISSWAWGLQPLPELRFRSAHLHIHAHPDPDLQTVPPARPWTCLTTTDSPGLLAERGCPRPRLPRSPRWDAVGLGAGGLVSPLPWRLQSSAWLAPPWPPPPKQDKAVFCQPGFCQATAWEPPAARSPPLPGQPALALLCPPGEAPKVPNAATAVPYASWRYGEMSSSLDFVAASSGSDPAVLPASLPNPPQPGLSASACADACGWTCVYMYVHVVFVCLWPIHAWPCSWLVLEAWRCSSVSLPGYWPDKA